MSIAVPAHAGLGERLGVQRLVDELPAGIALVADPASDAVQALRGLDVPLARATQDAGGAAMRWLLERSAAFGLDTLEDALVVERVERLRDRAQRVLVRQTWRGLPVDGGDARLVISTTGRLRAVASNFRPGLSPRDAPRIGRDEAVLRSADKLSASLARAPAEANLWVRRDGGTDRFAWRVRVELADGRPATCWVDATTGELLSLDEGIVHAVGLVYPTDPRQPLAEEPLERLTAGPGLTNHAFVVEDQLYPLVTPLGPDGDYRYAPTAGGFDQVNAYWHCDRFLHGFLGNLGYAGPPESLLVRVNAPLDPNVALTSGRFVYYGRPIVGFSREPSRANDILYHELTHALLYGAGIEPGGTRREAGALHEGLADLLAAAYTGDPAIGEWLYLPFPNGATRVDQPANPWNANNYDRLSYAGAPIGSSWANGMILSGAVWDLRGVIGSACDSLVLESLDYLPTVPSWAHFANAMLQADEDHHATRFRDAIVAALANRAIRGAVTMPARIAGPTFLSPGTSGVFLAEPCCGTQQSYDWSARAWCRGAPCEDWHELGTGPELTASFEEDTELRLGLQSPWGDRLETTRFVGVRPPSVMVVGPRRLVQRGGATWTARATGMGPLRVQWQRKWRRPISPLEYLGEGLAQSFAADTAFDLTVTLLDGLGRVTREQVLVETFVDRPPPSPAGLLLVSQRADARAHAMETSIQLPHTGRLSLVVYDVRGRARARLWDGAATAGSHVVRWDAGSLEPGIYLLRVMAERDGTVLRFSIVR